MDDPNVRLLAILLPPMGIVLVIAAVALLRRVRARRQAHAAPAETSATKPNEMEKVLSTIKFRSSAESHAEQAARKRRRRAEKKARRKNRH